MTWLLDQWQTVMFWLGLSFYTPRRHTRRHPITHTSRKEYR
jgi:hypothetical protein